MSFNNTIALFKQYVPLLDEVYKRESLTSVLDGNADLAKAGANADELVIPMLSMTGLGDYARNSGYVNGSVTMTNETVKCNFDRGTMFQVDTLDNAETAGLAFGRLSGEFIRTKVVPELDAFRFAKYASKSGISSASQDLTTGQDVISALRTATNTLDEDEVSIDGRVLFITPTLYGLVQDLDITKSREVLSRFEKIVQVPQTRFYTAINQLTGSGNNGGYSKKTKTSSFSGDGTTTTFTLIDKPAEADIHKIEVGGTATTAYSYVESTGVITFTTAPAQGTMNVKVFYGAYNLNFLVVQKAAPIQFQKHIAPKVISPEMNQDADAWKFGYRNVGIADVYTNKVSGIYAHKATD